MRSRLERVLQVSALCLLALVASRSFALEPGQPAPQLLLQGEGEARQVPVPGKVTYVDFWASWCGPCRKSFPWMNEMHRKYGASGLEIVAVNLDQERSDAGEFLARLPAEFPVVYDAAGEAPSRYDVKGMPTSVLVGADGNVIAVHAGFNEKDAAALEEMIRSHLDARP